MRRAAPPGTSGGSALRKRGAVRCLRNRPKRPPSEREALAVAAAEAERLARQRLEAETERAAAIAGELSETRNRLAAERQAFTRRMDRVAEDASRHCAGLPAGWVRLYNEALGLAPAAPKLLPLPPELARLPEAPPPLAPGYGREHP